MKSDIFNLIILDESGSMSRLRNATIAGCNETLNTIRSAQEQYADTQTHYVSIYVFQSNPKVPSRYLVKNSHVSIVNDINPDLYTPWGGTPLYDAIGQTLADLKATIKDNEYAIGNVTIITDGMENASQHYTSQKVAKMISELKEMGWSFNFIGANIDVKAAATKLNIDNALEYKQNLEGTRAMFARERSARMKWAERTDKVLRSVCPSDHLEADASEMKKDIFLSLKKSAKNYFQDTSEE